MKKTKQTKRINKNLSKFIRIYSKIRKSSPARSIWYEGGIYTRTKNNRKVAWAYSCPKFLGESSIPEGTLFSTEALFNDKATVMADELSENVLGAGYTYYELMKNGYPVSKMKKYLGDKLAVL